MKNLAKTLIGATLWFLPLASAQAADPILTTIETREFVLNNAQQFTLKAQTNGREYHIFMTVPQVAAPPEGFPVIYAVDGNAMFPQIAATANLLRMNNRAVFVGIGYPGEGQFNTERRYFDLTPLTPDDAVRASGRTGALRDTGGNDLFLEFIENELKPLIESRTSIDRQKQTLFGHSLGGLFTLHVLFSQPQTFQNYAAAAPSVWWNNQSILEEKKAFLEKYQNQKLAVNVLITTNTDPTRRRPTPAPAKSSRQTTIESSDSIITALKTIESATTKHLVFENETHISMVPASINSALRFVLGDSVRSQTPPPADTARGGAKLEHNQE